MTRRQVPINPKQAENLKQVLTLYGMSQRQLAESASISQQAISRIVRGKAALHDDIAKAIVGVCPGASLRWEWLMGYDEMMTEKDYVEYCRQRANNLLDPDSLDMHSILMRLAYKSDYIFAIETIKMGDIDDDLDLQDGITRFFLYKMNEKNEKASRWLSNDELRGIEQQIIEFVEFLLWKELRKDSLDEDDGKVEVFDSPYISGKQSANNTNPARRGVMDIAQVSADAERG